MQAQGQAIRRRRTELGYGLRNFAQVASISPAHLSRIERQQRHPSPEVLARIAEHLGTAITEIARHETEEGDAPQSNRR